jgi:hypothetical protein
MAMGLSKTDPEPWVGTCALLKEDHRPRSMHWGALTKGVQALLRTRSGQLNGIGRPRPAVTLVPNWHWIDWMRKAMGG